MADSFDPRGVCCGHSLNWHNAPTWGGACSSGECRCGEYISPNSDYVRCTAIRPGTNTIRRLECELVAGHSVHHRQGYTRWMDDVAAYPDKDPTLSAEAVREQLALSGVTAGQKVPQCPYWYEGLGLSRAVRCELPAHLAGDHEADIGDDLTFRWTSDVARWRDPKLAVEDVKPSEQQVGGDHYVKRSIGPWDIWAEYGMNAFEGAVLKYLLRWRDKGGVEDLKKARHTLDKLIEVEEAKGDPEAG